MQYSRSDAKDFARKHFRGIWAAIPTPFNQNDEIDESALRRDLRHYVDVLKIDGLFFGGVVGEFWALTLEERKRLHEIVLDELGDDCMTIAHTACPSLRDTIALTQHAQEKGSTFAVCINPPCNPAKPEISISFFNALCREVDLGISLFNNHIAGYSLSSATIAGLADIENIISVKEATLDQLSETRRLCSDRILVFDPVEDRLCENIIAHGDQCFMSSPYPYLLQSPGHLTIRDYAGKAWNGDHDGARRLSASLDHKRKVLHKWLMAGGFDSSIPVIKFISEHIGLTGGSVRAPMSRLTSDQENELRRDLNAAGFGEVRVAAE